jgi:hypothetical protein
MGLFSKKSEEPKGTNQGTSADETFQEACLLKAELHARQLIRTLDDRGRRELSNRIVSLSEEAISKGLSGTSAVSAYATIGDTLVERAMEEDPELQGLRMSGLSASPTAARAMRAYESALKLDAGLRNPLFSDQNNRNVHFHVGFTQFVWAVNSYYIRRSRDAEAAITYLKSILSLFEYMRVPVAWWIAGVLAGMYEDQVRPGITVDGARTAFANAAKWGEYSLRCERMPDSEVQGTNLEQFSNNLQRVKARAAKAAARYGA